MKFKFVIRILLGVLLINIFMSSNASAEIVKNQEFEHLSIDEGLSNEHVTTIFQDSKGYMWIGTIDGLNRYDGERVKIYNCRTNDKNTLSSTYINAIEEDDDGNIWIGTDNGLDILIRDTDKVLRIKDNYKGELKLGELEITSLLKDKSEKNIMWVGTEYGLIRIDIKNKTKKAFYHNKNDEDTLTNSYITCLEDGENDTIWVGTKKGINLIDKNLDIIPINNKFINNSLFVYDIEYDNSDSIWISSKEGIFIYDVRKNESKYISVADDVGVKAYDIKEKDLKKNYNEREIANSIYNNNSILVDKNEITWISTSQGIIRFSREEGVNLVRENDNFENSLSSNIITCYYEDFNGTIWVGTEKGINILNKYNQFNNFPDGSDYTTYLHDKNVVSILKHNEFIWVATKYDGIYIFNESGKLIKHIYNSDGLNLSNLYIKDLFAVNDDYISIITNKEILIYNLREKNYNKIIIEQDDNLEVNYIYADREFLWIATTNNLYKYSITTKEITCYRQVLDDNNINYRDIKYILQDYKDENIFWLGGNNIGLVKFHKEKGVIKNYKNNPSDDNSLINNYINCMTFDDLGNLWIGSNIGLSKFNLKTEKFTSYTTAEGLTNNFINSILIDDSGNLWISTNKGLNKFDVEKEKFTKFTQLDGIHGYQFNLNSSLKMKDGTMVFGSTEGITYFNPDDIVDYKDYERKVVIGDIYVDNNRVTFDGDKLVLEHDDKNLSIEYFLPNYENLNYITYEYMIEGIDPEWIYLDNKDSLDIKVLEPGDYKLRIRARNNNGNLTEETYMNIKVKESIWKTPLAYLVYIMIFMALIAYMINYVKILHNLVNQKTKNLNKQLEENKRLSKEIIDKEKFKNDYFVNLSHELRTPINVIISTSQLINRISMNKTITSEKLQGYMNIISRNCNNLLKIISDIIDSSKLETGQYKIYRKNNDIVYVVEEAALDMSKFIEEKGLKLIIDPDMEEKVIYCDATEIERCIINLLANAVKFTPEGGEIRVYIKEVEDYIEIIVEDTGIGISQEDQEFIFKRFSQVEGTGATKASSSGIGLTLVKYIIELHGGYIRLESELNKGSRFTIGIPNIVENIE